MIRFLTGQIVLTPAAIEALDAAGTRPSTLLTRHQRGDWGGADAEANESAVKDGDRILSVYTLTTGVKVWIITEADRSSTCILLPEDY